MIALEIIGENENWYNNNVSCKLGVGSEIEFWRNNWLGSQHFQVLFPNVFEDVFDCRPKVVSSGGLE